MCHTSRILARAWSEEPAEGSDVDYCAHVIAVNTAALPLQAAFALLDHSASSGSHRRAVSSLAIVNVSLPFEPNVFPTYIQARHGAFLDSLPAGGTRVYRLGCTVPDRKYPSPVVNLLANAVRKRCF